MAPSQPSTLHPYYIIIFHIPARPNATAGSATTDNSRGRPAISPLTPQSSDVSDYPPPLPHTSLKHRSRPLPSPRNNLPLPLTPPALVRNMRPTPLLSSEQQLSAASGQTASGGVFPSTPFSKEGKLKLTTTNNNPLQWL